LKYILENQETERLRFRIYDDGDKDAWMTFMQATDVIAYIGLDPEKSAEENFVQWHTRTIWRYDNNMGGLNMMIDKKTNALIGACGLLMQEVDGITELEIGYQLLPANWHNGFAIEGAKKCRDFAFENNFAESLISIIDVKNIASKKVAINNGMQVEKKTDYKGFEVDVFRIWRKEWEEM
jgi:[ribosomal protein S5]-alanine N-acetyltransferase